jgi:hypothetical protein
MLWALNLSKMNCEINDCVTLTFVVLHAWKNRNNNVLV